MEGVIYVSGQTKAYLDNTYVIPLLAMRGLIVTLATPRPSLNSTWKLDKATFVETKDYSNQPILKFILFLSMQCHTWCFSIDMDDTIPKR